MDEKDFERIGQLVAEIVDARLGRMEAGLEMRFAGIEARFQQIDERFEKIDARFDQIDARFEQIEARIERAREEFQHLLGLQRDSIEKKIQLLAEGQQMLLEKVERLEARVDRMETSLDGKIERLIVEFAAHVADKESHSRVYRVKEDWIRYGETSPFSDKDQGEQS